MVVVVVVEADAELFEVVLALRPCGRRPDLLHGRQQQADQDRNDRHDDEEFDQGEGRAGVERATGHDPTREREYIDNKM